MMTSDPHPLAPVSQTPPLDNRSMTTVLSDTLLPSTNQKHQQSLLRSVSEHGSIQLKTMEDEKEDKEMKPQSSRSLKRNLVLSFRKPRSITVATTDDAKKVKGGGRKSTKKKLTIEPYQVDGGQTGGNDAAAKVSGIFRQPPRGEVRFVHLDPQETKYGFRLQSYGRARDQGKVLQTFVQSVIPGSPSFMAGLHPGDTIVAVNGTNVKYAPVETVVKAIQEGAKSKERIILQVEFVDGVTRLDCMQKAEEIRARMKAKQARLREILRLERTPPPLSPPPVSPPSSPQHIIKSHDLPAWADAPPTLDTGPHPYRYNRHLNQVVGVHGGAITTLECDVLVLPITSCYKRESENENVLLQLLRNSGDRLLDELSLAKQCRVGDNIITRGHGLQAKYVFHCVFGDLQDSLYGCCHTALDEANLQGHKTVVFWLDGFAAIAVSPKCITEAVRLWLQQETNSYKLERVIFSSRANLTLVETFMHDCFPLLPLAQTTSPPPTPSQNGNGTLGDVVLELATQSEPSETQLCNDDETKQASLTQNTTKVSEPDAQNEDSNMDIEESEFGKIGNLKRENVKMETKQDMSKQESELTADHIELDMDDVDIGMGDSGSGVGTSESDSLQNENDNELLDYLDKNDSTTSQNETTPTHTSKTPPLNVRVKSHDPNLSQSLPAGQLRGALRAVNERGALSFTPRTPHYLNPDRLESDV